MLPYYFGFFHTQINEDKQLTVALHVAITVEYYCNTTVTPHSQHQVCRLRIRYCITVVIILNSWSHAAYILSIATMLKV